ncbi:MAG: SEL1-like repeat protein [Gammaproteobacteria bacterium]|nr:SEL1-like repeat protein [Gammaproteobacteria bacterium]MDE0513020.1 SEL1-like repeat protein [Gammaproteobacteria bacterium]
MYKKVCGCPVYQQGEGIPQDYIEAHKWFNLAASRVPPNKFRGMLVNSRDETAKNMTPDQIDEAQRLAREWTKAHGGN